MSNPIDFGGDQLANTVKRLDAYVEEPFEDDSEEPWEDYPEFERWLKTLNLGDHNTKALIRIIPPASLEMNHGPLLGVERFIEVNSEEDHNVLEAGFLVFATGPNGDFIVVDMESGNGKAGWLPMAMIWEMSVQEVRNSFVPTNGSLGALVLACEEEWDSVAKDWYDAKSRSENTN